MLTHPMCPLQQGGGQIRLRLDPAGLLEDPGGPGQVDPFEGIPGVPGLQRIRKRADGACGFLSPDNRCRIHEELGAAKKPLRGFR